LSTYCFNVSYAVSSMGITLPWKFIFITFFMISSILLVEVVGICRNSLSVLCQLVHGICQLIPGSLQLGIKRSPLIGQRKIFPWWPPCAFYPAVSEQVCIFQSR